MGARPLRRAIQHLVEDPLSERLLNKEFTAGQIVIVDVATDEEKVEAADDAPVLVFRSIEGFEPPTVEMAVEGAE
jgi:ATP-dependent Clp protease ATP-binding subunit ClpC